MAKKQILDINEYDPDYVFVEEEEVQIIPPMDMTEAQYVLARQPRSKTRGTLPEKSEVYSKLPIHFRCMDVPEWARYSAVDEDGTEWMFENEPVPCGSGKWIASSGKCLPRFRIIKNWRDTLKKFTSVEDLKNMPPKEKKKKENERRISYYKKVKKHKQRDSLALFNKSMRVKQNTKLMFNTWHKRWRIYKVVDGKTLYCTGSIQVNDKSWEYRFYSIHDKKRKKRIKYYTTESAMQNAIDIMVEKGVAKREELHIDFWLYSKNTSGELVRVPNDRMERYYDYLKKLEEWKNGRVESGSTNEEEDDYECEDEGDEDGECCDDFDE